jgi:hypothetical protein
MKMEVIYDARFTKHAFKFWMALPAVAFAAGVTLDYAQAQKEDDGTSQANTSTPYAEVQYATLTGSTDAINVTMLPLVTANGVVYENVTVPLEVSVSSKGVVTVKTGTPTVVAAPIPVVSNFVAGSYVGPGGTGSTGTQLLTLAGPGVTSGGATEWSVTTTSGATGCTFPTTATFYVGPLASNPLYPRLNKAGITSTAYSYGVMGAQACYTEGVNDWWYQGAIVGFSQTANALNIVTFSYGGTEDQSTPGAQITYTLK